MRVRVEVLGPIANKPRPNPKELELPEPAAVIDALRALGYSDEIAGHLVCLRSGQRVRLNDALAEGDELQAVLHVGGG